MASSIIFKGKRTQVPQTVVTVDGSDLQQPAGVETGIIALIGEAEGGRPVSQVNKPSQIPQATQQSQALSLFRSGDLREAANICFAPSNDPNIPGGANQIFFLKVNPSTKSSALLVNAAGTSHRFESIDFGAKQNEISVEIADSPSVTNAGKLVTITFEGESLIFDDVGGEDMFTVTWDNTPAAGFSTWSTMDFTIDSLGTVANGTTTFNGGDAEQLLSETGTFTAVSSNAGDTTQVLTVVGVDAGNPTIRTVTLNGTTSVTVGDFSGGINGAFLSGTTVGSIDIVQTGTNMTIAAGSLSTAGVLGENLWIEAASNPSFVVSTGTSTADLIVVSENTLGQLVAEQVTLNDATPVPMVNASNNLREIVFIASGAVAAAVGVTLSGEANRTTNAQESRLQNIEASYSALNGFTFVRNNGELADLVTDLDYVTSVSVLTATPFRADAATFARAITNSTSLLTVTRVGSGLPDNTTAPVFLTGGSEGVTTNADWLTAFNRLRDIQVNTIVPVTHDPAVHATLAAHLKFRALNALEADAVVGIMDSTTPTNFASIPEAAAQASALNNKDIGVVIQGIERFNTGLVRTAFEPKFLACAIAGMQSSVPVGEPLTRKLVLALDVNQDPSWSVANDGEATISNGLLVLKRVGNNFQVVRNITSQTAVDRIDLTDRHVNQVVNHTIKVVRDSVDIYIGTKGTIRNVNGIRSIVNAALQNLVDDEILVRFKSPTIQLNLDTVSLSLQIQPVIGINFLDVTLHLFNEPIDAA